MWPTLIVMFELTMLGGMLATMIALLVSAGIPIRQPKLSRAVSLEIMTGHDRTPAACYETFRWNSSLLSQPVFIHVRVALV